MQKARSEKLDYELARLVDKRFEEDAEFPIIVRLSDSAHADSLETCLAEVSGSVRHRLDALSAVSAWIPFGDIGRVAGLEFVEEMELSQPEKIARA